MSTQTHYCLEYTAENCRCFIMTHISGDEAEDYLSHHHVTAHNKGRYRQQEELI